MRTNGPLPHAVEGEQVGARPKATVLIADDTPDIRLLMKQMLEASGGFTVVAEASDGAEAVEFAAALTPDLVVLDLAMPVMDGLQAIPEIIDRSPRTKIAVLSGFAAGSMARETEALGAHAYIEKGTAPKEMVARLRVLVSYAGEPQLRLVEPDTGPEGEPGRPVTPEELAALRRSARAAVTGERDLDAAFRSFTRVLERIAGFDRASYSVTDGDPSFRIVSVVGPSAWRVPKGHVISMDPALEARVTAGETLLVHDAAAEPDATNRQLLARGIRSYISIPVLSAGTLTGLVSLSSDHAGAFSDGQVPLLESAVREAGGTLRVLYLLERERRESEELREMEQTRSEIMDVVAHDLRTPIAVIHGLAEAMLPSEREDRPGLTLDRVSMLQAISRNAKQLERLVERLVDATRAGAGKLHCDRIRFDLGEVVSRSAAELGAAQSRSVTIEMDEDLPGAMGDPSRQRQILANLITNAFKNSSNDTSVEVSVRTDGDMLRVAVADHGSGVEPGMQLRMFDRFTTAHRGHGGIGLGLFICRSLVEAQGGTISVDSVPSQGSTFSYTVPRA